MQLRMQLIIYTYLILIFCNLYYKWLPFYQLFFINLILFKLIDIKIFFSKVGPYNNTLQKMDCYYGENRSVRLGNRLLSPQQTH